MFPYNFSEQFIDRGIDIFWCNILEANYAFSIKKMNRGPFSHLPCRVNRAVDSAFVPPTAPRELFFHERLL